VNVAQRDIPTASGTRDGSSLLAAPSRRGCFRVLLGHPRQRQEGWRRDCRVLTVEVLPSHLHGVVSLRIWILVDSAEDLAVVDQLGHVCRIVTENKTYISAGGA